MKFKVGDKVKVMRKSTSNEVYWNPLMNKTIGKTYTVLKITPPNLLLDTKPDVNRNFFYPRKGVKIYTIKNQQLEFNFMNEAT